MAEDAKQLADNLAALAKKPPKIGISLDAAADVAPIPAASGVGYPKASTTASGIASPLTEIERTLYTTATHSSDGLFTWEIVHTITMQDANDSVIVFEYAAPA